MNLLTPVILQGKHAALIPLAKEHCEGLADAVKDGELWKAWYTTIPTPENMAKEIEYRLTQHQQGKFLPFTVIDNLSQKR